MCTWGTSREITIERRVHVDACIADQIVELNRLGIHTTGCCCGHSKGPATATILPSAQARARELGYTVTFSVAGDSWITLGETDVRHRCDPTTQAPTTVGLTSERKHDKYQAHYPAGYDLVDLVDAASPTDNLDYWAALSKNLTRTLPSPTRPDPEGVREGG